MKNMLSNSSHGTTKNGLIARTMFGKVKNSKLKRWVCHLIDKVEWTKKIKNVKVRIVEIVLFTLWRAYNFIEFRETWIIWECLEGFEQKGDLSSWRRLEPVEGLVKAIFVSKLEKLQRFEELLFSRNYKVLEGIKSRNQLISGAGFLRFLSSTESINGKSFFE